MIVKNLVIFLLLYFLENERAISFNLQKISALYSSMNKVDKFKHLLSCEGKLIKEVARFCKNAFKFKHDLLTFIFCIIYIRLHNFNTLLYQYPHISLLI